MKVRVYQPASGPVRILYANPKARVPDEADDVFLARIAARAEAVDPTLDARDSADLDVSALPATRVDVSGAIPIHTRSRWRLRGGQVVVAAHDEAMEP
jgi:hypothetical protein